MNVEATSRLRMWGYCLVLTAVAFVQAPGRIVGDTKLDLVVDPAGFLARTAHLWDPTAAFGQIQNQAYGYLWPMGPFFLLGDVLGVPAWVVQRLWWAALLCVAFVGVVKLARALEIGRPWTHVVAGFAFALSAHVLTLLGPTSVEAWPTAWAPWVLLPLVRGSRDWSPRRGAALSALAVAMCGGVNAVAVSAVLPLGALWVATRERGRRRRQLFGWWLLFTALATLWWVVPLLLLGRYSVPFLDYIENAPITTLPTSLPDVLGGTADWVAYLASQDWVAAHALGTTPFLLVDAAVVAGAGLVGVVHRGNPHRQFLFLGVLVGVVLVGFGYTGPLSGWWSHERLALLDAGLAPFRNLHKYDVVLRLCLVLGLSHFLTLVADSARRAKESPLLQRMTVLATVVAVVGLAAPAYTGLLAPRDSFDAVPDYWRQAADYLGDAGAGVSLVVPASAFGDYLWGSPHDDVLQPLASAPWASRNVIPLAQPGNVRFLDAVTAVVERGRPSSTLGTFLAANGVGRLVVRNDVAPARAGTPDPVVLHQALDLSPGLVKVAEFGPAVGTDALTHHEGVRILSGRGRQRAYAAVEVYRVEASRGQVSAWRADSVPVVSGDPGAGLEYDAPVLTGPTVLAGDRSPAFRASPRVLTDGLRRRETAFTSVRYNQSATMSPFDSWTLRSVEPNHRLYADQDRYETRVRWVGVVQAHASSSQAQAAVPPPIRVDRSPAAAVDTSPVTQWVSSAVSGAVGQWWSMRFDRPIVLDEVTVTAGDVPGTWVDRIQVTTDAGSRVVDAPPPGEQAGYVLPEGPTRSLRLRAVGVDGGGRGEHFALAGVEVPGVRAVPRLDTPAVFTRAPDEVLLGREPERPACARVGDATVCDDFWKLSGEEPFNVRRTVTVPGRAVYDASLTAMPRRGGRAVAAVGRALPVQVETSRPLSRSFVGSGVATLDGDPGTAWVAAPDGGTPYLRLSWDRPRTISRVDLELAPGVPGALPEQVLVVAGDQQRTATLRDGRAGFEPLRTDEVELRLVSAQPAYSFENGQAAQLPIAVGELRLPGSGLPSPEPDRALDLGCGSGPVLSINGVRTPTRLDASLAGLLSDEPLPASPCAQGGVALDQGTNFVSALRSPVSRPEGLRLSRRAVPAPRRVLTSVRSWTASSRSVEIGARERPAVLVVNENINAGWRASLGGRQLRAQRVNGWMQGWVVPPGAAGEVVLTYTPETAYRAALLAGLVALVLVAVAATIPVRRHRRDWAGATGDATVLVAGTSLAAGGLLAGWVGFAGMAVAVVLHRRTRMPEWSAFAAGALVAAAGIAMALARSETFTAHSMAAQSLALAGLILAASLLGVNGPRSFSRRKGRSSR